jgi:hypothetical protein
MVSCPDEDGLLRDELGELTVNRSAAVRAHIDSCEACARQRVSLRQVLGDLRDAGDAGRDAEAFVAGVEAAARRVGAPRPAGGMRPRARWAGLGVAVVAAAAAAVALVPAGLRLGARRPEAGDGVPGTVTARGGAAAARLGAEVLLVRDGRLGPVAGQAVGRSDALAVRVTNLSGRTVHLMAFGRDAAGDVHWLYPGYRDERANPSSVAIASGVQDRLLDEVVQPDAPAAGPLRLVTLVSEQPLTVKEVEARLAKAAPAPTAALAGLFPGAVTREWTARWREEVRR